MSLAVSGARSCCCSGKVAEASAPGPVLAASGTASGDTEIRLCPGARTDMLVTAAAEAAAEEGIGKAERKEEQDS